MTTKFIFTVKRHNQKSVELEIMQTDGCMPETLDSLTFSSPDDLRTQAKEFLDAHNALVYYAEKLEGD